MKRLTLLRHAKSDQDDAQLRDFDRGLNAKGRRAARTMGRHMREAGFAFDHGYASPAVRVVQTLAEVAIGYGRAVEPELDQALYLASAATLLDRMQDAPEGAESLLMVGHNPGLERLVLLLVPDASDDEVRGRVELKYPTASLAEVTFAADRWVDCAAGTGRLTRFVRPRDLDPALGPDEVG